MTIRAAFISVLAAAAMATGALAVNIDGAGASFPYPVYAKWAGAYRTLSGVGLNYQSIGSGGGIAQIKARTVTFGASDAPLHPGDLAKYGLVQFPTIIGGVVPVINVRGIGSGQLVLNGKTLADIFMGRITRWNDPAIKALNPHLNLPRQAIAVVHRADASGTSYVFTTYLSRVSNAWKGEVGAATAVDWPTGIGAKGNEGVSANVGRASGAIGYVEYAYAEQNHLKIARMINRDGKAVVPSAGTFQAAAAGANWDAAAKRGFDIILVNQPGPTAWPITATTYILVHRKPVNRAATAGVLKFFKWAYANGDKMALSLGYVPLPDNAVQAIQASWKQVQGGGM